MTDINQLNSLQFQAITGIFTDIDGTLSTDGKLTSEAFEALWNLYDAGLRVIVVTGRPAGWCDHIARFWPVHGVIGENGAFYFYHDGLKLRKRFICSKKERVDSRRKLFEVCRKILSNVQGTKVACDQPYRECDAAIDFCEDVKPLKNESILRIKKLFEQAGAKAKISSIHVNGWYGDFDKLSTAVLFAKEILNINLEKEKKSFIFCGDSPNDEPMFKFFPFSFGMANIKPFLPIMKYSPTHITSKTCGGGFKQVADIVLKAKKK